MPWRGLEWRLGFQVNFTKLLHGCCLPDERVHCACPLVFPATPAHCAGTLHWNSALARCTGTLRLPAGPLWPPPITVKRLSCIMPFPLKIITFIIICPSRLKMQKDILRRRCLFVRTVRLELTQANAHYPLKVACLPFHHVRNTLGLQSYELKLKNKIFLRFFCVFLWSCSERRRNCVGNSSEHTA